MGPRPRRLSLADQAPLTHADGGYSRRGDRGLRVMCGHELESAPSTWKPARQSLRAGASARRAG